jgi:hypothetical protein
MNAESRIVDGFASFIILFSSFFPQIGIIRLQFVILAEIDLLGRKQWD